MPATPDIKAVLDLVFRYASARQDNLIKERLTLAHYTSAEVAAQILLKQNIWMRNASSMNDYMEVTFGSECLKTALGDHRDRFTAALEAVRPNLANQVLEWLDRAGFNHQHHTYLTSMSEHDPDDELGLLSMWRAYGGAVAGVALVFNTDFLAIDTNALAAWSSPVVYGKPAFLNAFEQTVEGFEQNRDLLRSVDPDSLKSIIFNALQFAILSTKHIGFQEEREWRVIHLPRESASAWVEPTFETVRGKPEVVYHLPLANQVGMNLPQIDLNRLLHRVIIGPCLNPYQVASTFEDILRFLKIENPGERIRISHIPLRQAG